MRELEINERFRYLLPPKSADEIEKLEELMCEDLSPEPVTVWARHNQILDGQHRYEIAQKYGLELQIHEKHFDTEDEATAWIIWNQMSKRNLDTYEKRTLIAQAIELARPNHATMDEAVAEVATSANVSKATAYRAMQQGKMGYENQVVGDELDQSMPEENYFEVDEYAQDDAPDEFAERAPVDTPKPKRKTSKAKSVVSQQKSVLRAYELFLNKIQGLSVGLHCEVLEPDYRAIFDSIEKFRSQMPQPKKKFGR